jgi:hypothetical protein
MSSRRVFAGLFVMIVALAGFGRAAEATDVTGTWNFSVDLSDGGHGDPTFVFTQDKEVLTGSYDGPLGQLKVKGTVMDNKATFGFDFTTDDGVKHTATYTGVIESAKKMSGTVQFTEGPSGRWTAAKL